MDEPIHGIPKELCERIVEYAQSRWIPVGAGRVYANHDSCFLSDELYVECFKTIGAQIPNFGSYDGRTFMRATRYKTGDFINRHQDIKDPNRRLSVMVQLSDPATYEGGQLVFDNNRPVLDYQGAVNIFNPQEWHQVLEVTKGIRYSLIWWLL